MLVLDDEPAIARVIARVLQASFDVVAHTLCRDVLADLARGARWDAMLVDYHLDDRVAPELLASVARIDPAQAARAVIMSGGYGGPVVVGGVARMVQPKPLDVPRVVAELWRAAGSCSPGRISGAPTELRSPAG